jgi:heme exporter protein D
MDGFLKFIDMGGYALWVWPAYGAAVVGLVGILVATVRGLKAREREFESLKAQRRGGEAA